MQTKNTHSNPTCEIVYIELPEEAAAEEGECGKLEYWLSGCRLAAQAWERFSSGKFEVDALKRGEACGVVLSQDERDVVMACHRDDFTLVAEEQKEEAKKMVCSPSNFGACPSDTTRCYQYSPPQPPGLPPSPPPSPPSVPPSPPSTPPAGRRRRRRL